MVNTKKKIIKMRNGLIKAFYYTLKLGISFGLGFFAAQSNFLREISPFSLILLACSSKMSLLPTACYLGSTFGYLAQPFNLFVFKYITALTMVYIIYIIFWRTNALFFEDMAITSASCCFISGFLFLLVDQLNLFNILLLIAESVLICCSIFFVLYAIKGFKKNCYLTSRELIAASVTLVLILISLHDVTIFQMEAARILGLFIIITAMYCLKTSHCAVLGSCIGIILAAVSNGGDAIFTAIIASTLMGCVFSNFSERLAELSMIVVYYAVLIFFGKFPWYYWMFAEPMVAYAAAFFLPKEKIRNFLSSYIIVKKRNTEKIQKENHRIIAEKCFEVCKEFCPKASSCRQKNQYLMVEALEEIEDCFNQNDDLGEIESYLSFCSKPKSMAEIIERQLVCSTYEDFDELTEKFTNLSKRLERKMEASVLPIRFLRDDEEAIKASLKSSGIDVKEIYFISDKHRIKRCKIKIGSVYDINIDNLLNQVIAPHFPKGFSLKITKTTEELTATAVETNQFNLSCAAVCKSKNGETLCGDKAIGFTAGNGLYYLMLSDGMGCGKSAEIKSENAIVILKNLLCTGISVKNAIDIYRSYSKLHHNIGFATIDICRIDLNAGSADFYKSGAYDSFHIHEGEIKILEGGGLPIELSEKEQMKHKKIILSDQSYLIMASDGFSSFDDHLDKILLDAFSSNVRHYAGNILRKVDELSMGIGDDLTIIVAKIKKSNKS